MSNCSNFIDLAAATCGVDVGFGKVILLYAEKKTVPLAELTATTINAIVSIKLLELIGTDDFGNELSLLITFSKLFLSLISIIFN